MFRTRGEVFPPRNELLCGRPRSGTRCSSCCTPCRWGGVGLFHLDSNCISYFILVWIFRMPFGPFLGTPKQKGWFSCWFPFITPPKTDTNSKNRRIIWRQSHKRAGLTDPDGYGSKYAHQDVAIWTVGFSPFHMPELALFGVTNSC